MFFPGGKRRLEQQTMVETVGVDSILRPDLTFHSLLRVRIPGYEDSECMVLIREGLLNQGGLEHQSKEKRRHEAILSGNVFVLGYRGPYFSIILGRLAEQSSRAYIGSLFC